MLVEQANAIVRTVSHWVKTKDNIRGLALVGSFARNAARGDSDIDLILLTENPTEFRDTTWLPSINWLAAGVRLLKWDDEEYGVVWSRRAWFEPECEVEFTFALTTWADVSPVDIGTSRVISDGCRILYDPEGLLKRLTTALTTK
jgi:uncharacterized protein